MVQKEPIVRPAMPRWEMIFTIGAIVISLSVISRYNYLLFHSLVEIFAVIVAGSVFIIVWNSRKFLQNNYFIFLGVTSLFIGFVLLLHALAYKGMGVFSDPGANLATQLWILSRYLLGLSFVLAPLMLKRSLNMGRLLAAYGLVVFFLLGAIFYWGLFPVCYIEGIGLTTFKIVSEYIIVLIFLSALAMLAKNRPSFDPEVRKWLMYCVVSFAISELFFTTYISVYGLANEIGHFFELAGFYFLYKATIEIGLAKPYQLIFRDLKRSEEQLRREKEKIAEVASFPQLNPNPVCEIDMSGKIIYLNPAAMSIFPGLAENAPLHPYVEGLESVAAEFTAQKTTGPITREVKVKDAYYLQAITYINIGQKRSWRIYGMEITKRKEAETILKQAREELEQLVIKRTAELAEANEQLHLDMIELQDKERRIKTNNELLRLLNQTSSRKKYLDGVVALLRDLTGCRCAGIRVINDKGEIPYESHTGFSQKFWETENWLALSRDHCACIRVIAGMPEPQDKPAMTSGGSFCCANTLSFVSHLSEQEKSRFRGVCVEQGYATVVIIPIKYNENTYGAIHLADERAGAVSAKQVELIESLTPLVGEGIHKLVMAETMEEAKKELADAKRLSDIGVLAATVAHELRNPLAAMRMASYNIRKKAQNPFLDKHLDNIEKKITESNQIINNLLFYSRLKTPHYELSNLGEILEECVNLAKERFSKKSVVVTINVETLKKSNIEADPLLMKELFSNILNNAYDAMNKIEGQIEIGITPNREGISTVFIKDNGIGMDPAILKKAHEPFFTTKSKGTGLGLSVCNQIVHVHKGAISIDSTEGVGTTITIDLPKRITANDQEYPDH